MDRHFRERVLMPVAIILGAAVVTEIVVFAFSRVLLASSKNMAVIVATVVAVAILAVAAVIAARPRIRSSTLVGLLVLSGLGVVGAGVATAGREREHHEEPAKEAVETVKIKAENVLFDKEDFDLRAGGRVAIELDNPDVVPHNLSIYADESAQEPVFKGEDVRDGGKVTYRFKAPDAGSYYFQCDIHPAMNGTVTVEGSGADSH
ncbi:MAG TPA: cupredoxin domain-containing protein [Actinomycetota bacterium]|nr:cupredoxin domain-containing protein [Actinomycetota bacterium]